MRTFEIKLPDCETVFVCKRVSLRDFKKLIAILEQIKASSVSVKTLDLISEALSVSVVSPSTDLDELIDFTQSMQLVSEIIKGGKVNDAERKKSE